MNAIEHIKDAEDYLDAAINSLELALGDGTLRAPFTVADQLERIMQCREALSSLKRRIK